MLNQQDLEAIRKIRQEEIAGTENLVLEEIF